jgi:hypothetical protein
MNEKWKLDAIVIDENMHWMKMKLHGKAIRKEQGLIAHY